MNPDFIFGLTPGDIDYDVESFPNVFTFDCRHKTTGIRWYFEISDRRNDLGIFCLFIEKCQEQGCRWIGFNNLGYDYPVVHFIYQGRGAFITAPDIYRKSDSIINTEWDQRFTHRIYEDQHLVPQIDLYTMHHFDNQAKAVGLKILEVHMRMDSVEEFPYGFGINLTNEQIDELKSYNRHDVDATSLFSDHSTGLMELREALTKKFGVNMMSFNNGKIGETIMIQSLEEQGVKCFEYVGKSKQKRQTHRDHINLSEVIFPYVTFEHPEFRNVWEYFNSKVITETKGVFNDLVATIQGVEYKFGTGGLHASVDSQIVSSSDTHQLVDVDVASYYPNLAIKNKIYPEHLGVEFCTAYEGVYNTRRTFAKGTPENAAYKEALNIPYGMSNSKYSCFYDSQYTMAITINGQLLLCMLVEQLIKIPGLTMIQANTDGVTYLCPREYLDHSRSLQKWWEQLTQLELEEVMYKRMFIRDVNNYIAEKEDGSLKRIGAYAYETALENPGTRELPWHKDWSAIVVAKAAEAALVHGDDIRSFITNHNDPYDFFLRTKVPRGSTLEHGGCTVGNVVRYYISTEGAPLEKVSPPAGPLGAYKRANSLTDSYFNQIKAEVGEAWDERIHTKNRSVYEIRRIAFHTGYRVQLCNDLNNMPPLDINYEWYIKETEKLVNTLKR